MRKALVAGNTTLRSPLYYWCRNFACNSRSSEGPADTPHFQQAVDGLGRRLFTTPDTAQSGPQRPIQARFDMTVPISLIRLVVHLRCLHVPQVDVETLDLFDQQENRLSGRAKLLIVGGRKTRAPSAELLDLGLVQTIAQRSVHQGLEQCTTP